MEEPVLYVRAALLLTFAVVATVIVTVKAWPANRYLVGLLAARCRALATAWRERRDPAARRRRETLERYENVFGMLMTGEAQRRAGTDDGKREARAFLAAEYLGGLPDADLALIAAHLDATVLDGRAGTDAVRVFLDEERRLARSSPWAVSGHARRFLARFKEFAPPQEPGDAPLASPPKDV